MTFDNYSEAAKSTCLESCKNITYLLLGLNAEVGEVNDLVAKWRRKSIAFIKDDKLVFRTGDKEVADGYRRAIAKELGDVLWFCDRLADEVGFTLDEIARMNVEKLADRKAKNEIITHKDH